MNPSDLNLFFYPSDRLRMTVGNEYSYPTVVPAWASPLSHPEKYLSLVNVKGEEIILLENAEVLNESSRNVVMEELRRRYLTSTIKQITNAKVEFGATYWSVITERGPRDFVAQSLQENAQWLSDHHLILVDIDGNRFEIPDVSQLDAKSQNYIYTII